MRKILIGATHSDAGKTTITLGIMRALYQRGLAVQPFKVGPDYIDTGWHQIAVHRASRNLDAFMLSASTLNALFSLNSQSADISIIEGVMGLYDGFGMEPNYCSSAGMAMQLDCPVILVVDGKSVSTSIAATVQGFIQFSQHIKNNTLNIAAVIVNRVNSDSHYQLLKQAIEHYCHIPVLGRLPNTPELALPSRHLGLVPSQEHSQENSQDNQEMTAYWQKLTDLVEQHIDLDQLLAIAQSAPSSPANQAEPDLSQYPDLHGVTIAVAKDKAFHFYYQDNLDLLTRLGATLVEFSPLADQQLPACQAIYIGGGFPEIHAAELAANHAMRQALLAAHQAGISIYAECGGLMYLGEALINEQQQRHEMVGILQGYSEMTKGLQRFGYAQGEAIQDTLVAKQGSVVKGHEFHYSQFISELPTCFAMSKVCDGQTTARWQGGYQVGNTLGSYLHLHFYQSTEIIDCWLGGYRLDRRIDG